MGGRNLQNDFAVLFVTEDFVLDQHLDTACLPAADEVFDGTTCFATGWGKDQFGAAGQYQVVLEAWLARTLARVMEAVPWCVPPSMIPTPMSRLVSWPGVLDAERMELLESTLMLPRPHAGSTRQSPVTTELHQETSVHTSATPAMSARPGTTTRSQS